MGDSPGLSGWDQHYHEGPNPGKKEAGGSVRGAVMTEAEVGQKEGFDAAGFADGGRGHGPTNAGPL